MNTSLLAAQSLVDDPFAASTSSSSTVKPRAIRRTSSNRDAFPSPPNSSDVDMEDGDNNRPVTPTLQMGHRRRDPDYIDCEARTPSPKNSRSSAKYLSFGKGKGPQVEEDNDPFAAPKKNSRLYQGQGIKRPQSHVMTYVFRGKKVLLNQPLHTSDSEDELPTAGPQFLFPQHAPESPVSPRKPTTPPKHNPAPPTPQSNFRRGNKRLFGKGPSDSIHVLKDESDEDVDFSSPHKRARVRQETDFAGRVGGGGNFNPAHQGRVLFQ